METEKGGDVEEKETSLRTLNVQTQGQPTGSSGVLKRLGIEMSRQVFTGSSKVRGKGFGFPDILQKGQMTLHMA